MNGDFPNRMTSWTGMVLDIKNELTCFDYDDVDNEIEGDYYNDASTGEGCNATPNGFTFYLPMFYMKRVQGSDRN